MIIILTTKRQKCNDYVNSYTQKDGTSKMSEKKKTEHAIKICIPLISNKTLLLTVILMLWYQKLHAYGTINGKEIYRDKCAKRKIQNQNIRNIPFKKTSGLIKKKKSTVSTSVSPDLTIFHDVTTLTFSPRMLSDAVSRARKFPSCSQRKDHLVFVSHLSATLRNMSAIKYWLAITALISVK